MNIVITKAYGNTKIVFNDISESYGVKKGYLNNIAEVIELETGGVAVTFSHTRGMATSYQFSFDGDHGHKVDKVNNNIPKSDEHLCNMIGKLMTRRSFFNWLFNR